METRRGRAGGPGRRGADRFGAAGASLGFQYQTRYALLLLLRAEPGYAMTLEKTDDIALERDDNTGEWVQTKHHGGATALGDASPDLWKTLRNWSSQMLDGSLDPHSQTLILVTTSTIKGGTAASLLRPDASGGRDEEKALGMLAEAARRSKAASVKKYYGEFARLERDGQLELLRSVIILGSEPNAEKIKESIKKELRLASPQGKADAFIERVEGWWFDLAVKSLSRGTPIRYTDLQAKITDIRNHFGTRSLPVDYASASLPAAERSATRTFVRQLEIVGVSPERQEDARLDFYKASSQRSRWTADDLVMIGELPEYDKKLTRYWSDLFYRMKEDLGDCDDEKTLRDRGREHYNATIDTNVKVRPDVSDPYVMRGSLHMLADKPEIGWHPNYASMIAPQEEEEEEEEGDAQ